MVNNPNRQGRPDPYDNYSTEPRRSEAPPYNAYRGYRPRLGIDLRGLCNLSIVWIVVLFAFVPPLAVLLLIGRYIGRQQRREADEWMRRSYSGSAYQQAQQTQPPRQASRRTPPPAPRKEGNGGAIALAVCGVLLAIGAVGNLIPALYYLFGFGFTTTELTDAVIYLLMGLGGLGMVGGSFWLRRRKRLWKKLQVIVGKRDHVFIDDLAGSLSMSYKDTSRLLESAIDHGQFGPSAYLDLGSKCLVVRGEAPEAREAPKPEPKPKPTGKESEYDAILRQLQEVNEAIPGKEMSAKIDRIEVITAKIFELAQNDPTKLPQLRRFMDYYLPTALKLLQSYAEFDRQGVDGAIISESKRKIEETMDTLVQGFEQQLDKLFRDDALDVSADIDVLKNMMEQDGLNGDSPFSQSGSL